MYYRHFNYGLGQSWEISPRTATSTGESIASLWADPAGGNYTNLTLPEYNAYWLGLNIQVIRTPLPMRYDPTTFTTSPSAGNVNVSCELPDYVHDHIMAIALDDAGIASRDDSLLKLNQAGKSNITPPK